MSFIEFEPEHKPARPVLEEQLPFHDPLEVDILLKSLGLRDCMRKIAQYSVYVADTKGYNGLSVVDEIGW